MSGKIEQTRSDEGAGSTDEYKTQFSGVDLIEGSSGDDFVKGSSGDDKFRPGYGNDGFDGGKGIDTVYYDSAGVERTMVNLSKKYAEAWYSDSGYDEASADFYRQDSFAFSNQAQYDGLKKVENVVGSHGDDTIRGDDKKNYFYGGAGNDVLNGKDGNDTLNGGDGDDKLRGLNGKDRFEFDFSDGADSVYAFEDGADKFIINGGLTFADVEITDLGKHALITFGETSVTVMGTDHALLGEADFIFA